MAEITRSRLRAFQLSQTKNPMPVPPESISPATMTIQAIPMLRRMPVRMCGRLYGTTTRKKYCVFENWNTRATFLCACGTELAPNAVLIIVGHREVTQIMNTAAWGADWNTTSPMGNQANG